MLLDCSPAGNHIRACERLLTRIQCVDVTFLEPGDERIAEVNETNCYNSTDIGAADIYSITLRESGSDDPVSGATPSVKQAAAMLGWLPLMGAGLWLLA